MAHPKTTAHRREASHRRREAGSKPLVVRAPSKTGRALEAKPGKPEWLLQRFHEAFAKSREVGRRVSFRVDISPDGGANVSAVEDAVVMKTPPPVEEVRGRAPALQRALAAARERGRIRAAEVLAQNDMLSAEAFAELLGTTRVTVNTKRQHGQLLGLDGATRGFRFPTWQLDRNGKPYPELPALFESLGGAWAVYRFLVQRQAALDGLTGREALERGKGAEVVAAAEGIARGDFT